MFDICLPRLCLIKVGMHTYTYIGTYLYICTIYQSSIYSLFLSFSILFLNTWLKKIFKKFLESGDYKEDWYKIYEQALKLLFALMHLLITDLDSRIVVLKLEHTSKYLEGFTKYSYWAIPQSFWCSRSGKGPWNCYF